MKEKEVETVLILQGGGSLGAFGCGVFKALSESNIQVDIAAGTSIGGINAAIIAGSKETDHPEKVLEQFWLELASGSNGNNFSHSLNILPFIESLDSLPFITDYRVWARNYSTLISFFHSALFGNSKMFVPRWDSISASNDPAYFQPYKWTFLYDHFPLSKTLERYIDYAKLKPERTSKTRLVITAVDVLTAQPLLFDSNQEQITSRHILATSAYPLYYFPWIEIKKGVFAWDGGLLSNTPLREVIEVSPVKDKILYVVENYPKNIKSLPKNIFEVRHRARDIIFGDKTLHNIKMAKVITMYLKYIDELYEIVDANKEKLKIDSQKFNTLKKKYDKFKKLHGAEIRKIYYITREEKYPQILENADFSPNVIKDSINEGVTKTKEIIESASRR